MTSLDRRSDDEWDGGTKSRADQTFDAGATTV